MRIISGLKRGLKLKSLEGSDTRPTLDNVKEAIFSMLFDSVEGADVLDLFAGSGALGLEALSRGAKKAVFVDSNPKACQIVRANIESAGFNTKASVIKKDARDFIIEAGKRGEKFSLIFLDPPYNEGLLMPAVKSVLPLVSDYGFIVCEHPPEVEVEENIGGFSIWRSYRYGKVHITVYKKG